MSAGSMPDYSYRPTNQAQPFMRTRSFIRARHFNDTYFRATDPGGAGNRLSVGVHETGVKTGMLVVTNHNTKIAENVRTENASSVVNVTFLDASEMTYDKKVTFTPISNSPSQLNARVYSISLQIAPAPDIVVTETDLGLIRLGQAFVIPGVLSVCFGAETQLAPGDVITIQPRIQRFPLSWTTVVIPDPSGAGNDQTYSGWDIENLRSLVSAAPKWIEMLPRSTTTPIPPNSATPIEPPFDIQDSGYDWFVLNSFNDVYLKGGDGLPETPDGERTGPIRSIIHINYGELYNGVLGNVNVVYEWSGDNHINGEWLNLFRT